MRRPPPEAETHFCFCLRAQVCTDPNAERPLNKDPYTKSAGWWILWWIKSRYISRKARTLGLGQGQATLVLESQSNEGLAEWRCHRKEETGAKTGLGQPEPRTHILYKMLSACMWDSVKTSTESPLPSDTEASPAALNAPALPRNLKRQHHHVSTSSVFVSETGQHSHTAQVDGTEQKLPAYVCRPKGIKE